MTWKIINTVRSAREDIDPAAGANHKMRAFYSVLCEPCELWYILFSLHTLSSACSDRQGKRLLKNLVGSGKMEVENFQQSLRPPEMNLSVRLLLMSRIQTTESAVQV